MAIKFLVAKECGAEYKFLVHTDTKKVDDKGEPLPGSVCDFVWGKRPPKGVSDKDYLESIKQEIKLLCAAEAAPAEKALDLEGKEL